MGILLRVFAFIGVLASACALTKFFVKRASHKSDDCKKILAENRKELINKMNKDIDDTENRTSQENHEKIQKELENVDWDNKKECE